MSFTPQNNHEGHHQLLSEIVGSYIINLDSSTNRYNHIIKNVNPLGLKIERISAINGDSLSETELATKTDLKSYEQLLGHLPNLGTIGCSLSHIKVWQTFLASNFAYAMIFEDDVSFDHTKLLTTIEQLLQNDKLWDIATFNVLHNGTPLTVKKLLNNQRLVIYLTEITTSGAYIIDRKAAAKLLEKALPIKMPIDHYFTKSWKFNLKLVGIEPRIAYQTFGTSDIGHTKKLTSNKKTKTVGFIIKYTVPKFCSYIYRFLYNLNLYIIIKSKALIS